MGWNRFNLNIIVVSGIIISEFYRVVANREM